MEVAKAAINSGVARIKLNLDEYKTKLEGFSNPGTSYLKYVEKKMGIAENKCTIVFAEGCDENTVVAA